ncbi:MAG: flagellar hook-length control protein FliK [Nitrospira sp.]|nr:flagellar hook-length control protein FliK [Nitrospira sp.]
MTMLVPVAMDVEETRELSASGPAESKKFFGDLKCKDPKGLARRAFPSTLRAAERAQNSSNVDSKVERVESRPHQGSRPRAVDEQNELPVRAVNDRRFSDDGFSDDDGGNAQPAGSPAGCRDENKGSEAAVTGSAITEQRGGLLSQDQPEPSPGGASDLPALEQWAWLTGINGLETVGMSSLESESTPDGHNTTASSEPMSFPGSRTPDSSLAARGPSVSERHDVAAQGRDEKGGRLFPTGPSVPLSEVSIAGPSPGGNQDRRPANADGGGWPPVDQPIHLSASETQEPTLLYDLAEIEISSGLGYDDPSSGKLSGAAKAPTKEGRSAFSLGQGMSLHAVSSHATFPGGEAPSADLFVPSSSHLALTQWENQIVQQEQPKRDEETLQTELQNSRFPGISPAGGQEQVVRLIQHPEMVAVMGASPQPTPVEGGRLSDGVSPLRVATVGLAQETIGAASPRAVAFEVSGPELGHVNVRVAVRNELVHAHMLSDRPEVAAYLATGHDRLQSALQASGLEMGHFRVDIDRHGANRSFQQNASPEQGWSWQLGQRESEPLRDQADWSRKPDRLYTGLLNVVA